jgi:hypothetical protein
MAREDLSTEEQNAIAHAEHLNRKRLVRDAFVACFGPPDQPTVHGKIVLDFLDAYGMRDQFKIDLDEQGRTDVPKTFCGLGRRQVIDEIHRQLKWKEHPNANSSTGLK